MATTDQTPATQIHIPEKAHPGERTYVKVALVLGVITAAEIAVSYIDVNKWVLILSLIVLSAVKFILVVQWFMHLKFDHPTLRKPFIAGMVTALTVYTIVLANLVYHSRSAS
ncbi:MAG TPA: cytochrome C oxidase subunit IV family protein [Actinomycetota bacterium]